MQTIKIQLKGAGVQKNQPALGDFVMIRSMQGTNATVIAVSQTGTETVKLAVNEPFRFDGPFNNLSLASDVNNDIIELTYGRGYVWPFLTNPLRMMGQFFSGQQPDSTFRPFAIGVVDEVSGGIDAVKGLDGFMNVRTEHVNQAGILPAATPNVQAVAGFTDCATVTFQVQGIMGGDTLQVFAGLQPAFLASFPQLKVITDMTTGGAVGGGNIVADGLYQVQVKGLQAIFIKPTANLTAPVTVMINPNTN